VLALQRAAGNRAVSELLQVQRYKTITHEDYVAAAPDVSHRPFLLQGEHMEVVDRPGAKPGNGIRFPVAAATNPSLHVADDDSLAINAEQGEPKDFFALPGTFAAANAELKAVNSPVELFNVGNSVTLPGEGEVAPKQLSMVQPKVRGTSDPAAHQFAEIGTDICRDMAKAVMAGAITHAAIGKGDSRTVVPISTAGSTEVSGMLKLAEGLSGGDVSLEDAKARLSDKGISPTPGKAYGESLHSGDVATRGEALGINKQAKAQIGEAYVTQTIPSNLEQGGTKREYAADVPTDREFVWGYHFGATVAESNDGKDQILLENYARVTDLREGQAQLLAQLKEEFAEQLREAVLAGDVRTQIGQALIALGDTADTAGAAYSAMYSEQVGKLQKLWYFRMVGEGGGQSFHEQMAASGYFVNPLTVAVAHQQFTPARFSFVGGSADLDPQVAGMVRRLAKSAAADLHQGRLPGRIHIAGYSSGTWSPWEAKGIGLRRATAVGNLFGAEGIAGGLVVVSDGGVTTKFGETATNNKVEVTNAA
jgi:outer membrane protein OmpA-like peptidoglycan-associated protein